MKALVKSLYRVQMNQRLLLLHGILPSAYKNFTRGGK